VFLAESASTVQPWVWVAVAFAIVVVIFAILADLAERPSAGKASESRISGESQGDGTLG
jgi:hypothetical protein